MRGSRSALADNDIGERISYNPDFNGPLKGRSCTDVICLLLFLVFIGCWIGIGIFAFVNGDPEKLLIPRDSYGSRCGYDAHVKDKPYLHFFDLTKCIDPSVPFTGCNTPQVCVKNCPKESYYHIENSNQNDKSKTVCKYDINENESLDSLVKKGDCAKWVLKSEQILKRCLYKIEDRRSLKIPRSSNIERDEVSEVKKFLDIASSWLGLVVQYAVDRFSDSVEAQQAGMNVVNDIKDSYKEILLGIGLSIVVCIIYIVLLRWIAPVMVWLSILGALAGLAFCVYYSVTQYQYYKDNPYKYEDATNSFDRAFKKPSTWMWILIILSVILGLLFLIVVFLRKRIVLAIALIQEGSKAVSSTTSALFFPIIPWILQFGVICYTIAVAVYISTVGGPLYEVRNFDSNKCDCNYANGDECNVDTFIKCGNKLGEYCEATCKFIKTSNDNYVPYIHAFNIIGFFWGVFFISALCEMILAGVFATWYWTFEKKNVPFFNVTTSTLRTLRYHIGTLAFGSLIITICRIIRVILEYIDHKLKKYDNALTRAIMCCLKCFFWCLEKFLKFINRNAYIMCAVHGKNFCASAKDAFNLLIRNILRVFVLDKITDFLFFLSKIIVVIGVSSIIYSILTYVSVIKLNYVYIPIIFIAICTYLIASVFFKVYIMAIDTLFLCFLEDCERNDGSRERPYFMTKNLMNVLNKKNK
ncbi:choline transporter-like 2 isoform X1 [Onthophagus taurus]|uniref:choline transporter-like 2 isoform X1 n=1 Tax=Onthophagus taurus TaxID=166361 RepID=UPI0039BE9AD1